MYCVYSMKDFVEEQSFSLIKSGFNNYELACQFADELNNKGFEYYGLCEFFAAKEIKTLSFDTENYELYISDDRPYFEYRTDYTKYKELVQKYFPEDEEHK